MTDQESLEELARRAAEIPGCKIIKCDEPNLVVCAFGATAYSFRAMPGYGQPEQERAPDESCWFGCAVQGPVRPGMREPDPDSMQLEDALAYLAEVAVRRQN